MAFHKFIKAVMKGEEIEIYGSGEQTRDFTFIDDVVQSQHLIMENLAESTILEAVVG